MTREELFNWIDAHQCAEFNDDNTATYYIHLKNGELVSDCQEADTTISETISTEGHNDLGTFYEEVETLENPVFAELVDAILKQINEKATKYWLVEDCGTEIFETLLKANSLEEAEEKGRRIWDHLTAYDKKRRLSCEVVEAEENPEAPGYPDYNTTFNTVTIKEA